MSYAQDYLDIVTGITGSKANNPGRAKPTIRLKNGEIAEIYVHQHLLKIYSTNFNKNEICWRRLWHTQLIRDFEEETTESQLRGLYFETQCLGKSAHGEVNELPRLKNGEKSVAHKRIDEQIFNFKSIIQKQKYGIILKDDGFGNNTNCQIEEMKPLPLKDFEDISIFMKGTADIISPISVGEYDYPIANIDLKLTMDRNNTFGPFCWGDPYRMDHIQAFFYSILYDIPFFYWIFDYNARDRGEKIIPINMNVDHPDSKKANEARLRYKSTMQIIRSYCADILTNMAMGFPTNPKYSRCKNCPIMDCKDRKTLEEI